MKRTSREWEGVLTFMGVAPYDGAVSITPSIDQFAEISVAHVMNLAGAYGPIGGSTGLLQIAFASITAVHGPSVKPSGP